jgi:putative ABC transport system permease protein
MSDLRHALRGLRKSPGFTAITVLTLALGIGANTTMFSVLYGILLRPLPYPQPEGLVQFAMDYRGSLSGLGVTYSQYQFLDEQAGPLEVAASTGVGFNLFAGGAADRVDGLRVSHDYFRVLGVSPQLGRVFLPEEDTPGGAAVVMLSHGLWTRRFGADPDIVGRTIQLDGRAHTVVGVMPAGFQTIPATDVWTTLAQVAHTVGSGQNLEVIGRLPAGGPLAAAQARLQSTNTAFHERFSQTFSPEVDLGLLRYRDLVTSDVQGPVRVLFAAIGLVLLIACANVANLLIGRAAGRSREMAVRVALGATRWRLVRQMLTESVLLALAGGALGLLLAEWGVQILLSLAPLSLPRAGEIQLDRWALGFTFIVSLITGVAFGLLPAWQAAKPRVHEALKEGSRRATAGTRQGRLRGALVVGEIAVSLVLLVGAGLLIRTFVNLIRTDPGFEVRGLLTAEIWLTGSGYDSTEAITGFYQELTRRLEAYPGVEGAAVVEAGIPLRRGGNMPLAVDGEGANAAVEYRTITPEYLTVLGVPLERGRMFTAADAGGAEPVAIVNRTFAGRFLDGEGLGRLIRLGGTGNPDLRVVGVVGDLRSFVGLPPQPAVFIPSAQTPPAFTRIFGGWFPINVVVRTAGDPAALRATLGRVIRETNTQVPVGRVQTMEEILSTSLAFQRFLMLLLGVFAGLAVTLAAVGIYGVMAYFAAQRTHEIGVRLALGALPRDVVRLVLRRGLMLAGIGVLMGLAGAAVLTRFIANQLHDVGAIDPLTFAGVAGVLVLVALAACAVPALRASGLDPVEALRHE